MFPTGYPSAGYPAFPAYTPAPAFPAMGPAPVKRGSEILESDSIKRSKVTAAPSKVIHIRGLPGDVTEAELVSLCSPFGLVVKVFLLTAKQQGLVQMDSVETATMVVATYGAQPPVIRGRQVHVQFSSHPEISYSDGGDAEGKGKPNKILLVSIHNLRVPVTLQNIHDICRPHGEVRKIVTFTRNGALKALVEMATLEAAVAAKLGLEGKDMFMGCCHVHVGYSSLSELTIKSQNTAKERDFTVPGASTSLLSAPHAPGLAGHPSFPGFGLPGASPFAATPMVGGPGSVLLVSNLPTDEAKLTPDHIMNLFSIYGDVARVKILFKKQDNAMVQFTSPVSAQLASVHLRHLKLLDKDIRISTSRAGDIALPRQADADGQALTKDFSKSPAQRFRSKAGASKNEKNITGPSLMLHVSNLGDTVTDEDLVVAFAAAVEAKTPPTVHIFTPKSGGRRMAYVKFDSISDAALALMKLHNFKLKERHLRVAFTARDPSSLATLAAPTPFPVDAPMDGPTPMDTPASTDAPTPIDRKSVV